MAAVRTRVLEPFLTSEPVPEMAEDEKSVPWVMVLERLKTSTPLLAIALELESEPVVPPAPIDKVPAVIVVSPV